MATKANLIALVAAQLHQHVERVGVERVSDQSITQMVGNAVRIENAVDAQLAIYKSTTLAKEGK